MHMLSEFRKMPPAAALLGCLVAAPSVFALIQVVIGGAQITSLIMGALGGLMFTLKALRILNSCISPL